MNYIPDLKKNKAVENENTQSKLKQRISKNLEEK